MFILAGTPASGVTSATPQQGSHEGIPSHDITDMQPVMPAQVVTSKSLLDNSNRTTAMARLSGQAGANRVQRAAVSVDARDDQQAVRAWIDARAGSPLTAKQYERETERFILCCVIEGGRALADATAEDCRAYIEFVAAVPDRWITRRKVARMARGWAPFRAADGVQPRGGDQDPHVAFPWLVQAHNLVAIPWVFVNRKLGDDVKKDDGIGSRAFTRKAWAVLLASLEQASPSPSRERLRWICTFAQAVGLRAAELLQAKRGDLKELPAGWVIRVHGKERRNRLVPVPSSAIAATKAYFAARGTDFDQAPAAARAWPFFN